MDLNRIQSNLGALENSPNLEYLNLCGNRIKDMDTLAPLVSVTLFFVLLMIMIVASKLTCLFVSYRKSWRSWKSWIYLTVKSLK